MARPRRELTEAEQAERLAKKREHERIRQGRRRDKLKEQRLAAVVDHLVDTGAIKPWDEPSFTSALSLLYRDLR